jgi:hypothetical protein
MAESGFTRMTAVRPADSAGGFLAMRSTGRQAAVDPKQSHSIQDCWLESRHPSNSRGVADWSPSDKSRYRKEPGFNALLEAPRHSESFAHGALLSPAKCKLLRTSASIIWEVCLLNIPAFPATDISDCRHEHNLERQIDVTFTRVNYSKPNFPSTLNVTALSPAAIGNLLLTPVR